MSGARAALRGYEAELQQGLSDLRARREELHGRIQAEEAERKRLQGQITALTQRLLRSNESLARLLAERGELDRVIAETETAYGQILESSQILLSVLKEETGNAGKASGPQSTSKEKKKQVHGQKQP